LALGPADVRFRPIADIWETWDALPKEGLMSAFEFVFSLFGLLLGFSLVEVLGKLAASVKASPQVRLGWLTPLLSLFVLLDVTGFWSIVWDARDVIPPTYGVLVVGLAITGLYYFAASLIFPSTLDAGTDLDSWYFDHKSTVLTILLACQLLAHASKYALTGASGYQWPLVGWIQVGIGLAALVAAIFARGYRWNVFLLVVSIAIYLVDGVRHLNS
jgi:hypothetical protein